MPRGGPREGAGRKPWGGKFGEATQSVRVPVSLVDKIPEILVLYEKQDNSNQNNEALEKIKNLLEKWDKKTVCEDYSKNPRKRLARELWLELKAVFD